MVTEAPDGPQETQAPTLTRSLTLRPVVLFGLAYLAPMIVLGTFGVLAEATSGSVPTAYLLALIALLFTALSYGKMSKLFPVAGSAYTYTRRSIDGRVGFLVGWAVLLDYFFLPMVIWLIGTAFLSAQFPDVPSWIWIVAFIVASSALNVIGIKAAANANLLLMAFQVLVLAIFVVLSLVHVAHTSGPGSLVSITPFFNSETSISGVSAGAALAAYSFLGFDAITTLTEETLEPKKTIPRAILLVLLIGGAIFLIVTYATQLVHPGGTFPDASSAAFTIAQTIGGNLFSAIFLAGLVVTQFASGLAAQTSVARLLYAMGRDSVLPKRIFGYIHPRFHTPAINILLSGAVGLIALDLTVATSTSFINFGAFTAFTFVNLCVIAMFIRTSRAGDAKQNVVTHIVFPAIGAIVDVYLLFSLDATAKLLGLIWLACGILYLTYLTRFFRRPPPEIEFVQE
jgi:putrescine importer